jgi:branched-chain amino acid transport system permease protein
MGEQIIIITFVVVVIGGLGSVAGAFWGALLVGIVDTSLRAFLPQILRGLMAGSEADALAAFLVPAAIPSPFSGVGHLGCLQHGRGST